MSLYSKAKKFAVEAHESIGQIRKYTGKPYYTHVLAVAELVSTVTSDEEVLAAACLHDILEDVTPINPKYNEDWIKKEFGNKVLKLVFELTNVYTKENCPNINRKERKNLEKIRIGNISEEAKIIKRADLYHNSTELGEDSKFNQIWLEEKIELEKIIGNWL